MQNNIVFYYNFDAKIRFFWCAQQNCAVFQRRTMENVAVLLGHLEVAQP